MIVAMWEKLERVSLMCTGTPWLWPCRREVTMTSFMCVDVTWLWPCDE